MEHAQQPCIACGNSIATLHVGDLITIERTFHSENIQAVRTPWATQEPAQHSAVLRVTSSFSAFSGTTPTISVSESVARAHGWHSGCTVTVSSTAPQPHVLDTVEVSVKGLDATRAGLWHAAAVLCGSSLHVGQTIKVHDVPMTVRGLKIGGMDVRSGLMSKDTKLAFRSRSAHVVLMLHASREMWDVSPDGTVYAHMALRGFLPRLLQFWNEMGATHRVTVILFSRASIDADPDMLHWLGVPAVQSMDSATYAGQDGTPLAEPEQQLPAALPAAWPQRATSADTLAALDALPTAEPGSALATTRRHVRELAEEDMAGATPTALNAYANVLHGRSAAVLRGSDSLAAQEDFYEVVAEDVCLANWMSLLSSLKSALLSLPDRAGWGVPGATLQARSALAERATRCAIVLSTLGVQPSPEDLSVLHHGGAAPCQLLAPSLPSSTQSSRASSPAPAAAQRQQDACEERGTCHEAAQQPGVAGLMPSDLGLQEHQVVRLQDELRAAVHVLRYSQQVTPMLAAEGNFLEAINLALDSLAARSTDVALAHQGGTIIVVTAGAGHYEEDYLLAQMTKQRIMDAGFGCDVVSMCRPPLHNVPLFLFVKNPLASAGLVPVSLVDTRADDSTIADEQQQQQQQQYAGMPPPARGASRASSGVDQHASDVSLTRRLQDAGLSPDMLSAMASRMAYNFPYWLHMAFYGSQWTRDRAAMLRGLAVGSEHTRRAIAGLPDVPLNPLLDDTLADTCNSQLVEQALHTARAACAPQLQRQEQVSHAIARAHAALPVMPYSRMLSLRAPRLLPTGMELPPVLLARLAWQARDRPYMRLSQDRGTVTYVAIGTITARDALRGPLAGLMSVDVESASGVALIGMPTQLLGSGAQRSKALMTAARTLQRAYAHLQAGLLQQSGSAGVASASSFQIAMSTLHFSTDDAQQASLSLPASAAAAACAAGASQCAPRLGVVFRPASCPVDSLHAVPPISTAYFVLEGHLPGFKALHGAARMLPAALRSTAGAWEALCHADVRAVLQSAKLVDAHMTRPVLLWFSGLRKLITDSMYKSVSRAAWLSAWRNADLGLWQRPGPAVAPLGQSTATLHSVPPDAEHGRMRSVHSGGSKLALRHNSAGPSLRDAGGSLPPKYTKSPYLTPRQGARIDQANQIMLPISVGMPAVASGGPEGTRDRSHSSFSQPAAVPVLAAVPAQPATLIMARAQPSRTQSQMNLASVVLETSSTARRLPVASKPAQSLAISAKHGALPLCHSAERSPTFFIEGESPHVGNSLVTPQTQPAPAPEDKPVPELALNQPAQHQHHLPPPHRQPQVQIQHLGKASSLHTGAVLEAQPRHSVRAGTGAPEIDSEPRPARPSELRSTTSAHGVSMGRGAQGAPQAGRSSRSSPPQSFRLTSRAAHRAQARAAAHASSSTLLPAGKDMEAWARRTLDKFCANPFVRRTVTGIDTTANRRRWSHISPEQPEDELLAAVHRQGVWPGEQLHVQHNYDLLLPEEQRLGPYEPNWRALAEPAILPLTTDYLPDEATFSREFNESEYGMILPLAGQQQASARPRKAKGKASAAGHSRALGQATPNGIVKFEEPALPSSWGPGSLPAAQHGDVPLEHIGVIKALVCLRLAHGFQFVCPRDVQHKFGSGLSSGHSSLRQSSSQVRSIGKRNSARATVHSLWQGGSSKGPARTLPPGWGVRGQLHPSASTTDLLAVKEARPAASALRSGARVLYYLSIGHHIHQLSYNREQGQLAVRIYYRKWGWRTSGAFAALVAVAANTTMARELNASAAAIVPGPAAAAAASSARLQTASDARSARMLVSDMQNPTVAAAVAASKLTEDPQVQGYMMRKLEAASRMPDVFMYRYRLWHAAGQCSVVQHAAFAAGGAGVEFSAEARAPDATPRVRSGKQDSAGVVLMPVMARSGQAAASAGKFLERGNNWNEIDSYVTDGAVLDGNAACFQQVGLLVVPRAQTRAQCRTTQTGTPEYTWESFQGIIQHLEQHLAPRTAMPVVEPELDTQDTQSSPSQSPIAAKRRTVSTVRLHFPANNSNVVPESVLAPIVPSDYAVQNSAVAHAQEVLVVMPTAWQADSVWRLTVKWLAAPPARLREWLKALARCARTAGAALVPQSPVLRRSSLPSTVRLRTALQPCATLQLCTCVPGPVCSSMQQMQMLVDRRDWHVPGWSGGSSASSGSSAPGQVDALPSIQGNALEVGITLAASPGACVLHNKVGSWGKQDEVVLSMVQALQAHWGYVMDVWRAGDVHDGDAWYVQLLYAARDIVLKPHELVVPAAAAAPADSESVSGTTLDTAGSSVVSKTALPSVVSTAAAAAAASTTPAGSTALPLTSPPVATSQRSTRAARASANIVHPPPWPQFDAAGAWAIRIDAAGVHWLPNSHTQAALALLMYGQPEATSEAPLCVHTLRQHLLAVTAALHAAHPSQFQRLPAGPAGLR